MLRDKNGKRIRTGDLIQFDDFPPFPLRVRYERRWRWGWVAEKLQGEPTPQRIEGLSERFVRVTDGDVGRGEGSGMNERISIGRDKAIEMYQSGWWEGLPARRVAEVQLFIDELCIPFGEFHQAIEEALGRPVWTHEFGLSYNGLVQEFLGERPAPTLQEIIELIPEDKRIIVTTTQ